MVVVEVIADGGEVMDLVIQEGIIFHMEIQTIDHQVDFPLHMDQAIQEGTLAFQEGILAFLEEMGGGVILPVTDSTPEDMHELGLQG